MVETTKENCEIYTSHEIVAATESRSGLSMVGNTSSGDYINMIRFLLIHNWPITTEAITIANTTFGPDIATIKGKPQENIVSQW